MRGWRHVLVAWCCALLCTPAALSQSPWQDTRRTPDERARLLNAQLTLDERIRMLHGPLAMPVRGFVLPPGVQPSAGYVPGVERLGIPALRETDASLGVTNPRQQRPGDGATALPSGLALAATFNTRLAYESGAMIGAEAHAKGFNVLLAGGVNLARDPRNGRNFEYLGEDPLLAGTLGGESVRGIQDQHVIATVKHFVLNGQETGRHFANSRIDVAALRESDLLAFQIAIERGRPGSVMCAYNLVNDHYSCGNDFLLNQVLKRDWGYRGWVMSDWGAVGDVSFATLGLDQQSGEQLDAQVHFGAPLKAAVQSGSVTRERVSDMTLRILRSMFAVGLFEHPPQRREIDYAANARVARAVADEGLVLLKNDGALLPLADNLKRIAVIGGRADLGVLSGGGSSQVVAPGGRANVVPLGGEGRLAAYRSMTFHSTSVPVAMRARAPGVQVVFDDGRYPAAAAAVAHSADVAIVFANQWMGEGEDAPDLSLPEGQDALIAAVAAANPRTVVVLQTGGPVTMPWHDRVPAIVAAWYAGAGGTGAITGVLFGDVNPSGRLPVTFPVSLQQYPRERLPGLGLPDGTRFEVPYTEGADVGYRRFAALNQEPLYAFGHGLSYTQFGYANLSLEGGRDLRVSFDVTNQGPRAGADTPQVYLRAIGARRASRLIGFAKLTLSPGQTRRLTLQVDPRLLADFDVARNRWRVRGTTYHVALARSAAVNVQSASVRLAARWLEP